ncbi:MAG: ATP-binding protein [Anaerolineae bacterium]|nr:ATP-binding protein [Anaerolineae bacterium]
MPLRRRLLIYLLSLAIMPMLLVTLTAYSIANHNLLEIERANLQESAQGVVRLLKDIKADLAYIANDYAVWDELHAQAFADSIEPAWISNHINPDSAISLINTFPLHIFGIYNVNNRLTYNLGKADRVVAQLGDSLPAVRTSSEPSMLLLNIDGEIFLVVLTAIRTSEGKNPNGVLIVGRRLSLADAEKFRTFLGAEIAFYNGEQLIAATDGFTHSLNSADLRAAAQGNLRLDQSRQTVALVYEPIPVEKSADHLVIVLQRPRQALIAAQQSALQSLLIWLTFVSLAALLAATVISRPIVRTLEQMVASADKIAAGDYSRRIPLPERRDELYQVADAFNQMTDRLVRNIELLDLKARELDAKNAELMQANAVANEAVRMERDFIATMSHELRTPLTAIIGYTDMLLMSMFGRLDETVMQRIQIIRDNGSRLLALINDLLDLSRIQAGKMTLNIAPFSPAAMLERVATELDVLAHKNGLRFVKEIDPNLPRRLLGDEKRLQQIVTNLLSNAFKFTQQGEVRLRAYVNSDVSTWTISVSDTGTGIPPEALVNIFEKYRQVQSEAQRNVTGTGLGLSITHDLVRLMGGTITVESALNVGSTFTVILPMVVPQAQDKLASATQVH